MKRLFDMLLPDTCRAELFRAANAQRRVAGNTVEMLRANRLTLAGKL